MGRGQVFRSTERHGVGVVQLRTGGDGPVHDGIHLVGEQISKLVHAHEEAFETHMGKSIVPLYIGSVLHPDLHPGKKREANY